MGLMQLMPGTWRAMRDLIGLGPAPVDPHDNIAAGKLYLRLHYDRYGYPGLFAAYNAAPFATTCISPDGGHCPPRLRATS